MQDMTVQYSTIQYITIAHFTLNNIEHPRQPSICNITRINQEHILYTINPLPVQFKALLHGQKGCVFFSGHLNLRTTPETGLPSREKNHNN